MLEPEMAGSDFVRAGMLVPWIRGSAKARVVFENRTGNQRERARMEDR